METIRTYARSEMNIRLHSIRTHVHFARSFVRRTSPSHGEYLGTPAHQSVLFTTPIIMQFVRSAAGSSNGRTHPSGGCYLGSSPSPAALSANKFMVTGWCVGESPSPAAVM